MSTATEALPVDNPLPVEDDDQEIFTVEFRDLDRKELVRVEFATELDAVRAAGSYRLYVNTELVAVGPNVDSGKFTS
jgi:hypothetical protein